MNVSLILSSSPMYSLDITRSGEFFVTGSGDKVLKLWAYDEGVTVAMGRGHSGTINAVKISPDEKVTSRGY